MEVLADEIIQFKRIDLIFIEILLRFMSIYCKTSGNLHENIEFVTKAKKVNKAEIVPLVSLHIRHMFFEILLM